MFLVFIAYAYQKTDVWLKKKDISIQYSTQDAYFTHEDVFDFSRGLNIGLAFTAYDSETEPILDPSYGRIVFNAYTWGGLDENGVFIPATMKEIETHTCTPEELGLKGDNSAFMPINAQNRPTVEMYQKKFLCIDKKDMRLFGDYNSDKARILNMQLVKCYNGGYFAENGIKCQEEDKITEFLRNKFFLMIYNQRRFASGNFGD